MDLKNEQENMERILRPANDNYSWIIGYILAVVEILLPWVMLLVSSISNTEFPDSEFLEFLSYSTIIGLIIFVCLVRRGY